MMDIQVAKELKSSLMWGGVIEEIDRKIYFESLKLRTCTPEELPVLQAKLAAYEALKKLPDDVIEREET